MSRNKNLCYSQEVVLSFAMNGVYIDPLNDALHVDLFSSIYKK